VTVLDRPP